MNRKASIPISAILVFSIMVLSDIEDEGRLPNAKEWTGFVVVFTFLSAGSDLGFEWTSGLALLVLLSFALLRGESALEMITGKVSGKPTKNERAKINAMLARKRWGRGHGHFHSLPGAGTTTVLG